MRWTGGRQRLTATDTWLLLAEGHEVRVTLVKDAVAEWKRQRREVFVPLTIGPAISPGSISSRCWSTSGDPPEGVALPDAADVLGP